MSVLSDDDILEIIGFIPDLIGSSEDASLSIGLMRQAVTYLPDVACCSIDDLVPFITAIAIALMSVPEYDSQLPLNSRLRPSYVRREKIAQAAAAVMGLLERGGNGTFRTNFAVDMALTRYWLDERLAERLADPRDAEVCLTIFGRRQVPRMAGQHGVLSTATSGALESANAASQIQYTTRDQIAALCKVSKGTVERWMNGDDAAPIPLIEGGGGRARRPLRWPQCWQDVTVAAPTRVEHAGVGVLEDNVAIACPLIRLDIDLPMRGQHVQDRVIRRK